MTVKVMIMRKKMKRRTTGGWHLKVNTMPRRAEAQGATQVLVGRLRFLIL
jgi:hypothetical protein